MQISRNRPGKRGGGVPSPRREDFKLTEPLSLAPRLRELPHCREQMRCTGCTRVARITMIENDVVSARVHLPIFALGQISLCQVRLYPGIVRASLSHR